MKHARAQERTLDARPSAAPQDTASPGMAAFVPCFDWVVRATGDTSAALTYGIVWRYSQWRNKQCYASCERLASTLGWSRQRVMRHLQTLTSAGLITRTSRHWGQPHVYIPVSQAEWEQGHETQQVTPCVGNSDVAAPAEVTPCDTSESSSESTSTEGGRGTLPEGQGFAAPRSSAPLAKAKVRCKRGSADPRTRSPAIQAFRSATGFLPAKALYDQVIGALGPNPRPERVQEFYRAWCARGYNPRGLAWLLEWYVAGTIPGQRGAAARTEPVTTSEFAVWREFQESVQKGEDPDAVKQRLGL